MEDKTLVPLKIQDRQGSIINAQVEYFSPSWPNWILEFTSPITEKLSFRVELEKYDYRPLCNGARFDAYSLDEYGIFVNILTLGKTSNQQDRKNRVETFGETEPHLIVSVAEQRKNYESWLDSIKSLPD